MSKRKFKSEEEEREYHEARQEFVRERNGRIKAELAKVRAKQDAAKAATNTAPPERV